MNIMAKYQPKLNLDFGTAGSLNSALPRVIEVESILQRDIEAEPLAPRGSVPFDVSLEDLIRDTVMHLEAPVIPSFAIMRFG